MRVVVVGCGAVGSAAALALARAGHDVTVVEARGPATRLGSSHGRARIFRCAYDVPEYTELAVRSLERWRALEAEAGETLLTTTGCVDHGDPESLERVREATLAGGAESVEVPRAQAAERWPGLRFDGDALLDPTGGRIDAAAAVRAMARLAAAAGASLLTERVLAVGGSSVTTEEGVHEADAVVVATGAWTRDLVGGRGPTPASPSENGEGPGLPRPSPAHRVTAT